VNGKLERIWKESVSELPSWYLLEVWLANDVAELRTGHVSSTGVVND